MDAVGSGFAPGIWIWWNISKDSRNPNITHFVTGFLAGRSKFQGVPTISHMKDYPTLSLRFVLLAIVYFLHPWGFITIFGKFVWNFFQASNKQIQDNLIDICKLSTFCWEMTFPDVQFFLGRNVEILIDFFVVDCLSTSLSVGLLWLLSLIFTSRKGSNITLRKKYAVRYKWHLKRWMSFSSGGWLIFFKQMIEATN